MFSNDPHKFEQLSTTQSCFLDNIAVLPEMIVSNRKDRFLAMCKINATRNSSEKNVMRVWFDLEKITARGGC